MVGEGARLIENGKEYHVYCTLMIQFSVVNLKKKSLIAPTEELGKSIKEKV